MARARRILNPAVGANTATDYIPIIGGTGRWAYYAGYRIPRWNATGGSWRPLSAMTSDSAPSPYIVTHSSQYSATYDGWKAFNKSYADANGWVADSTDANPWITLKLDVALKDIVCHVYNRTRSTLVNGWKAFYVDGSDDGTTWYQLAYFAGRDGATSAAGSAHNCANYNDSFLYVRFRIADWERKGMSTDKYCAIGEVYIGGKYAS